MNYLKAELVMLFVIYCECWWPVFTGCCGFVCYVVQLCPCQSIAAVNAGLEIDVSVEMEMS
jgi:hypothetical protein